MKIKSVLFVIVCAVFMATQASASEEKEKMYLVQMLNQLDALTPLINAASKEQPTNARVKFHYLAFKDMTGHSQNGLLDDINEIKKGIQERLSKAGSEPHTFKEIKGDYVGDHKLKTES